MKHRSRFRRLYLIERGGASGGGIGDARRHSQSRFQDMALKVVAASFTQCIYVRRHMCGTYKGLVWVRTMVKHILLLTSRSNPAPPTCPASQDRLRVTPVPAARPQPRIRKWHRFEPNRSDLRPRRMPAATCCGPHDVHPASEAGSSTGAAAGFSRRALASAVTSTGAGAGGIGSPTGAAAGVGALANAGPSTGTSTGTNTGSSGRALANAGPSTGTSVATKM